MIPCPKKSAERVDRVGHLGGQSPSECCKNLLQNHKIGRCGFGIQSCVYIRCTNGEIIHIRYPNLRLVASLKGLVTEFPYEEPYLILIYDLSMWHKGWPHACPC